MSSSSHFRQLLDAAAAQPDPCRLLFVFAVAELPGDATPAEREQFLAGRGGTLAPVMCVDKAPGELADFAALAAESRQTGAAWTMVFAAGLGGRNGQPPASSEIDAALQLMVEAVRDGGFARFAAYDGEGDPVVFD
ncbi:MAG: ribonucleotide reductase subunit alpha [Brevundimonas sp.]|nr:ribonucleotide reductase subunit alpha [Brevundimonas sp.]